MHACQAHLHSVTNTYPQREIADRESKRERELAESKRGTLPAEPSGRTSSSECQGDINESAQPSRPRSPQFEAGLLVLCGQGSTPSVYRHCHCYCCFVEPSNFQKLGVAPGPLVETTLRATLNLPQIINGHGPLIRDCMKSYTKLEGPLRPPLILTGPHIHNPLSFLCTGACGR